MKPIDPAIWARRHEDPAACEGELCGPKGMGRGWLMRWLPSRAQEAVYKRAQIQPTFLPRNAGSWPGYVFTGDPLRLAAGHFGLGHGNGAHAPDEYYVIESTNPKIQGIDGAVRSYVDYLFEVAQTR